ncbi:uncharacterized protein LOC124533398 [Vanessa cardui]|uniref:uncharacterized protein LOC124533398 n=1 Tax=Vanessa cardui TaxID=171605 RepID=UPI001F13DDE0|nr:uncharacterized protein LOC124533398 [Vanessa cardui]
MKFFGKIKDNLNIVKHNIISNHLESIIWLVNILPNRAGFSILKDKISAPFWIIHTTLLLYVYGVGSVVYQIQFAQGAGDFIKSYVNISILVLTANSSYWFVMKRPLLLAVLGQVNLNDKLARATDLLRKKHEKLLSIIKKILYSFYGFNLLDAFFIYLPHRLDVSNDYYSMTQCYGLEPLTASPNREICLAILFTQELTIMTVVLNYQGLLLLIIAHTSAMYEMLSAEMLAFDVYDESLESQLLVRQRLPSLIRRHALTLSVIKNIKALYSMPFGVNFGSNAVCICLFFYLPLYEWITFAPVLIYCFLVFFLYCFLCQKLVNSSEIFVDAIYSCGWEKFALKEKKMIYVMLLVAHKRIEILAADIIPVNIYTFAKTLQAIFKFITVVKF